MWSNGAAAAKNRKAKLRCIHMSWTSLMAWCFWNWTQWTVNFFTATGKRLSPSPVLSALLDRTVEEADGARATTLFMWAGDQLAGSQTDYEPGGWIRRLWWGEADFFFCSCAAHVPLSHTAITLSGGAELDSWNSYTLTNTHTYIFNKFCQGQWWNYPRCSLRCQCCDSFGHWNCCKE